MPPGTIVGSPIVCMSPAGDKRPASPEPRASRLFLSRQARTLFPGSRLARHETTDNKISRQRHRPTMRPTLVVTGVLAYVSSASAAVNWTLAKAANPTADQQDAYSRIENAMRLAAGRYNRLSSAANKNIRVAYAPGVPTAEANYNGDLRFGSNRAYITERTALHEISYTLGIG
ncbi:hypothetical protein RB595_010420 [Gaeumannomyces hyphopodioides]